MKARRVARIDENICEYVRSRYTKMTAVGAQGMFNLRCHQNSVQYAMDNEGYGVAEVIYVDSNDGPVLHYVNIKDGMLFETTLGYEADTLEYYKIRDVPPGDWPNIRGQFANSLDAWLKQHTNWFDRAILGIYRVL